MSGWLLALPSGPELSIEPGRMYTLACVPAEAPEWEGKVLEAAWQQKKRVAVLPPDGGLIANLKGWENVTLPVAYHKGWHPAALEAQLQTWLSQLDLSGYDWPALFAAVPGHLSGEQRALLAWLRAALIAPDLILLWRGLIDQMNDETVTPILRWWQSSIGACLLLLDTSPVADARFEKETHGRPAVD